MRTVTVVQASFGSCCFFAAAETAVDALAEAMAVVTDATVSGSSYSFFAAAETVTDLAASNSQTVSGFKQKRQDLLPFLLYSMIFVCSAYVYPSPFAAASFYLLPTAARPCVFSANTLHPARIHGYHL